MNPTFQELMRDATRLTRGGSLAAATAAIQRALSGASTAMPAPDSRSPSGTLQAKPSTGPAEGPSLVLEGCVLELVDRVEAGTASAPDVAEMPGTGSPRQGEFIAGAHAHASLTRHYKLFVPPGADERRLPLVVMLHGCTQDPDDFAAGTGMNALAREQGFYVLYPAQAQDANPSRCWNWFKHNHQARDRGETAVIATMTHAVIQAHGVDPKRVYIAGLSAGGAMAALVAAAYPEIFAAVGVHSGLPPTAARSLPQRLAAMRTGASATTLPAGMHVRMRSEASPLRLLRYCRCRPSSSMAIRTRPLIRAMRNRSSRSCSKAVRGLPPRPQIAQSSTRACRPRVGAIRARPTGQVPGSRSPNTGWCSVRATPGRVDRRRVPTPIRKGPMPVAKCCVSSSNRQPRAKADLDARPSMRECARAGHLQSTVGTFASTARVAGNAPRARRRVRRCRTVPTRLGGAC